MKEYLEKIKLTINKTKTIGLMKVEITKLNRELKKIEKDKKVIYEELGCKVYMLRREKDDQKYNIKQSFDELDLLEQQIQKNNREIENLENKILELSQGRSEELFCSCGNYIDKKDAYCPRCGKQVYRGANGMNNVSSINSMGHINSNMHTNPNINTNMHTNMHTNPNINTSMHTNPNINTSMHTNPNINYTCKCGNTLRPGVTHCPQCGMEL